MAMSEITEQERKQLEKALDSIAEVQVAFLKREDAKPPEERNGWWSELYKCRGILAEYLWTSKVRAERRASQPEAGEGEIVNERRPQIQLLQDFAERQVRVFRRRIFAQELLPLRGVFLSQARSQPSSEGKRYYQAFPDGYRFVVERRHGGVLQLAPRQA